MVIMHNMLAINANRMYGINGRSQTKLTEKLSSGYRVNRSADDAAGLAISEKMRRQIRGLSQASANAQDGISMLQIADGAMEEIQEMLHRGTELCVKAANGTLTKDDREYIQQEISQLVEEIDGIAQRTNFNEIQVLRGDMLPYEEAGDGVIIAGGLPDFVTISNNAKSTKQLGDVYTTVESYDLLGTGTPPQVIGNRTQNINHAAAILDFSQFTGTKAQIAELYDSGFYTTCCTCTNHYSIRFTKGTESSMEQSGSHYVYSIGIDGVSNAGELIDRIIRGTDRGNPRRHYTKLARNGDNLIVYDDRSMDADPVTRAHRWRNWSNPDFNTRPRGNQGKFGPGTAYDEDDLSKLIRPVKVGLQVGAEAGQRLFIDLPIASSQYLKIGTVDADTVKGASDGIAVFKNATQMISGERSRVGAYQNRLEHTIKNLDNVVENTQAAESLIRDTDMAELMVEFTNGNILAQAGQAMLAQANLSNQGVLALLG